MRKMSITTTQDHVCVITETDEIDDETTRCLNGPVSYPTSGMSFTSVGTSKLFSKNAQDEWTDLESQGIASTALDAPVFVKFNADVHQGSISTSVDKKMFGFLPKTRSVIEAWASVFGIDADGVDRILDPENREYFEEFVSITTAFKKDPDTYATIEPDVPDPLTDADIDFV